MSRTRSTSQSQDFTNDIDVTFGVFDLSPYRVPYLSAVLRFSQAAEWLSLVTDDPKYATHDWSLTELFQRDIDQSRVIDIARNYLDPKKSHRPPFFNSLTVIIRANDPQSSGFAVPPKDSRFSCTATSGPIRVSFQEQDPDGFAVGGSFGSLAWNRGQAHAVAIDGQHRLAAIKSFYNSNKDAARKCYVSVIFLILDEAIGFVGNAGTSLEHMRSLFIDLNQKAVKVSRARNLILDDFSLLAACVRSLCGPTLKYSPGKKIAVCGLPRGLEDEFVKCLPLELVDWHGESRTKIDKGPYLTSILGLEWMIQTVLKAGYPKLKNIDLDAYSPDDPDYYANVKRDFLRWPVSWGQRLKTKFEEAEEASLPVALDRADVALLRDEFCGHWTAPLVHLLTRLTPYQELCVIRFDGNSLTPQFGQWRQAFDLREANRNAPETLTKHYESRLREISDALKDEGIYTKAFETLTTKIEVEVKKDSLYFYIVGQRALIHSLVSLVENKSVNHLSNSIGVSLKPYQENLNEFYSWYLTEAVNAVYQSPHGGRGVFSRNAAIKQAKSTKRGLSDKFWAGSFLDRTGEEMDFTAVAARRGATWLVLIAHLYWFLKVNPDVDMKKIRASAKAGIVLKDYPLGPELSEALDRVKGTKGFEKREGTSVEPPIRHLCDILEGGVDDEELVWLAFEDRLVTLSSALRGDV